MWFRSEVPLGQDLFTVASRSAEGKDVKTGQMSSDFSCLCFLLVFGNLKSIPWGPFGNVFNNTWWFFLDIYLVTFRTRLRLRPAHQSLALSAARQIDVWKKYLLAFLLIISLKPFILCLKSQRLCFCHFDAIHDFIGLCSSYPSVVLSFRLKRLNNIPSSQVNSFQNGWVGSCLGLLSLSQGSSSCVCLICFACLCHWLRASAGAGATLRTDRPLQAQGVVLPSKQKSRTLLPTCDETTELEFGSVFP